MDPQNNDPEKGLDGRSTGKDNHQKESSESSSGSDSPGGNTKLEGDRKTSRSEQVDVGPPADGRESRGNGPDEEEEGETRDSKKKRTTKQIVLEVAIILAVAAVAAVLIQSFLVRAFLIPSGSMEPTFKIGDRIMAEKVTYYFREPRRGDIVVFRYPPWDEDADNTTNRWYWPFEQIAETLHLAHRSTTPYVKRVIATGGERVKIEDGVVYINGEPIDEPYLPDEYKGNDDFPEDSDGYGDIGEIEVPEGYLFCMGDNRRNSSDCRTWYRQRKGQPDMGMIPERAVIGKVFLRWWPLSRFGTPD